jgi:hypothetical protein
MPYLNWKEAALDRVNQEIISEGYSQRLTLSFGDLEREQLLSELREVLAEGSRGELRLDLPRGWIIFWKLREGESRLLIAHPQAEEWVATASLDPAHAQRLLESLDKLETNGSVVLGELGPVGSVSNVEIQLVHLGRGRG